MGLVLGRLEAVRPALEGRFAEGTLAWDGLQFLVYRPGDFFSPHRDRLAEPGNEVTRCRRAAVVVFLNGAGEASRPETETFDGGALTFYGLLATPGSGVSATPSAPRRASRWRSARASSTRSRQ